MSFHTPAYSGAIAVATADQDLPALQDDIWNISNNHFLPAESWELLAIAVQGDDLTRARLVSPSNRQVAIPGLRPINVAAAFPTRPGIVDLRNQPFAIRGQEELSTEVTCAVGAGRQNILLFATQRFEPIPSGQIFSARWTSTTASVANTWTTLAIVLENDLPSGEYVLVGMSGIGATSIAYRAILQNQPERPGCPAMTDVGNFDSELFRNGRLGVWGRFPSFVIPQIQVLNTAAVAVHEGLLDIIKVS